MADVRLKFVVSQRAKECIEQPAAHNRGQGRTFIIWSTGKDQNILLDSISEVIIPYKKIVNSDQISSEKNIIENETQPQK